MRVPEAAVVILRDCVGVSGGRCANLARLHQSMMTRARGLRSADHVHLIVRPAITKRRLTAISSPARCEHAVSRQR